MLSMCQISWRW